MKPTMCFDGGDPPFVNEAMLRLRQQQKKQRIQTVLAAVGAGLVQLAVLVMGVLCLPQYPLISVLAFGYVLCAVLGSSVLALVLDRRKEQIVL